jgi:hypothetical protein
MNRKRLILLLAGAIVVAFTVFLLYPRPPQPGSEKFRFMHCPKCGTEYPYNPELAGKPCSRCAPFGPDLVPTTESVATTGGVAVSPWNKMFVVLLVEAVVLMGAFLYVEHLVRKEKTQTQEEYLYIRCLHCRRKLRFAATKAGLKGQCPRCKGNLVYDNGVPDEDDA